MIIQYSILLPSSLSDNTLPYHEQSHRQILYNDETNNGSTIGVSSSLLSPVTGTLHIVSSEKITVQKLKQYWPYEGNFHFRAQVVPASEPNNYVWMDLVNDEAFIPPLPVASVTTMFPSSSSSSSSASAPASSSSSPASSVPSPPLVAIIRAIPLFPIMDGYNDDMSNGHHENSTNDFTLSPQQYNEWKKQKLQQINIRSVPNTGPSEPYDSNTSEGNDNNNNSNTPLSPYAAYPLEDTNDQSYGYGTPGISSSTMADRVDEQIQQQLQAATMVAKEAVSAATSMFKGFMSKAKVTVKNMTNKDSSISSSGDTGSSSSSSSSSNGTNDKSTTGDPFA